MKISGILILVFLISCAQTSGKKVKRDPATEVDNFSKRYLDVKDSAPQINKDFNDHLKSAINKANRKSRCSSKKLYKYLNDRIGGFTWSKFEKNIEKSDDYDKLTSDRKESIFKHVSFRHGWGIYLASLGPVDIGSIIRVGDHLVGTDKIGHFIGVGWVYYKKAYIEKKGVENAIEYGKSTETGMFGKRTTGVYSYGDLAANFIGMKFWSELVGDLVPTENPYVKCVDNKWVQVRDFNWLDWADDSWDEGVNCNEYRNKKFKDKVKIVTSELEKKYPGSRFECPVKNTCGKLVKKYGRDSVHMIHPECLVDAALYD